MATATFQNGVSGYTGGSDTWLDEASGTWNQGGSIETLIGYESGFGNCRILHRWDLSSISSTSVITSATLQLNDKDYVNRNMNCAVNIYQPSVANANWVCGTSFDTTETGACCWNTKTYNTVNWAGSVGMGTATTDYVNTSLASYTFIDNASGFKTITFNASGLTYIQTLFGTTGGAGFLIIGPGGVDNTITKIASMDDSTPANRPILTIGYTPVSTNMFLNII